MTLHAAATLGPADNLLQTVGMTDRMLTAAEEGALVGLHKSSITRARQDPGHPAYRQPDGTFTDPRCDFKPSRSGPMLRAPQDAVEAWWAARRASRRAAAPEQTSEPPMSGDITRRTR